MATTYPYRCYACGQTVDPATFAWRCPCGGLLDSADYPIALDLALIRTRPATLWRYHAALPFAPDDASWERVTLGEGLTPLIPFSVDRPTVQLKVDYLMPTLSFKDRGAVTLVAHALGIGAQRMIADSSGNAGAAIAAYAARARIACDVYIPAGTSPKKIRQIALYGATVHEIAGDREVTAAAAIAAVEATGAFYASHVYNPYFVQGVKTFAYEIWEQLAGRAPDAVVVPVGNGTLVLGAYYGFRDLVRLGLIAAPPRIIALQAANCAPLAAAFAAGLPEASPARNMGTIAEGIAIAAPARHVQILAAVRDTNGAILAVPEHAILPAQATLARQGFAVEPTTATNWAGYEQAIAQGVLRADELVVIPLCGAGLKAS